MEENLKEPDLKCPVCGKGVYPIEKWRKEGYKNLRVRASWATPYAKKGSAWFYRSEINVKYTAYTAVHAVIESVTFGRCGYQNMDLGLTVCMKLEDGGGVCWTFYNYGDIAEFFQRSKADKLEDLIGTPVIAYMSGTGGVGSSIIGIDIIDSLVIR